MSTPQPQYARSPLASRPRLRASRILSILLSAAAILAAPGAQADELADLRARVEALERTIAQLQGNGATHAAEPVQPSAGSMRQNRSERFTIRANDETTLQLRGLLHFDARNYVDSEAVEAADGWVLRRARPILQARLTDGLEIGFTPEFAGGSTTILDAFLTLRAAPSLRITAGKFKVPVGLERIMAAADLRFIERALPTSLAPNRDLGVQLQGELARDRLSYSLGYFNGVSDGGSNERNGPMNDAGDWAARLFVQPFLLKQDSLLEGLGVGVAATYAQDLGDANRSAVPVYRTSGQQTFFAYREDAVADGKRMRLTAQAYYHYGQFAMLAEAIESSQRMRRLDSAIFDARDISNAAWQLQLAWLITGERQKFRGPIEPAAPFSPDAGAWGAFELVARYHELDIDDDAFFGGVDSLADESVAASEARSFGLGLNWYVNQYLKCSLSYERTRFEGGAVAGADRTDERFLAGRLAVSF